MLLKFQNISSRDNIRELIPLIESVYSSAVLVEFGRGPYFYTYHAYFKVTGATNKDDKRWPILVDVLHKTGYLSMYY